MDDAVSESEESLELQLQELERAQAYAYRQGYAGRLLSLEPMREIWERSGGPEAFLEGLERALMQSDPTGALDPEPLGAEESAAREPGRAPEALQCETQRIERLIGELFPGAAPLTAAQLQEHYPRIAQEDARLQARIWAVRAELGAESDAPMVAGPASLAYARGALLERLEQLEATAQRLRAEHALAVRSDVLEPARQPHQHRDTLERQIQDAAIPERFERIERLAFALAPDLAPRADCARAHVDALQSALRAPREHDRQPALAPWIESRDLLEEVAGSRVHAGELPAAAIRPALTALRSALAAQACAPARASQDRLSPPQAALVRVVAGIEHRLGCLDIPGERGWALEIPDVASPAQLQIRQQLASEWLAAHAEREPPHVRKALEESLRSARAAHWVQREGLRVIAQGGALLAGLGPLEAEQDARIYAQVQGALERAPCADPQLKDRALQIARAREAAAMRDLESRPERSPDELGSEWELED